MNKTKHFKRTAFPLSAKSMMSTLLLLIAMLMPQGAWAENFISEIKIGANSNQNTAKGYLKDYSYEPIERDLNYGNGDKSWYIYLGYKTDTDASKAITGIMIVSGDYLGDEYLEGGTKTLSYDGKTWYRSPAQGAADINKGAGGDDLTIFYTRDGNTVNGGKPLVSLSVAEETGLSGYTYAGLYKNGAFSANGSTNVGTKGAARYITYTTHTHAYTAAFNWATNGKSCTATVSCSCGDTHSNLACTVTDAPKSGGAATCTVMGWTTYTAKVTSNGKDFSATKDVQDIAVLGHIYSPGSWSWAGDGHSATCTRTCGRTGCTTNTTGHTSSKSVTLGNGITSFQRAAPTCNAMGMTRYTATATVEGTQYSATMDVIDIAALGHSYGAGSWSWADDGHSATCTRTCGRTGCYSNTPGHTSSKSVTLGNGITSAQQVAPKCTEMGTTRYTATTTVEGTKYSATKDVVDIAALDHSYGAGSWSWEDDGHSATCTRTCSHDANHTSSKSVTLGNGIASAQQVAPTCTTQGTTRYTATATVENVEYSDSKDVADIDIDPLNHNYGAGAWSWGNDGHSATCTRTCSYDANHTSSVSVTLGDGITSALQIAPTCGVKGTTRYTATATVENVEYTATKDVKNIAATGLHTFADDDETQCECTVCHHGFFRYTSVNNVVVDPNRPSELKGQKDQTITIVSNTNVDGKGVIELESPLLKIGSYVFKRTKLTGNLTIPNSVTEIGYQAFDETDLNGNITIGNNVTKIGQEAFVYNLYVQNVFIGNSVREIGQNAFGELYALKSIEMKCVPKMSEYGVFINGTTGTKTVVLSDDSYVYKESNPKFPTVASVTAPCTLDLTGSVVENHPNLTLTHANTIVDAAVAATCTTTGLTEGSHCALCSKTLVAQTTVPTTDHTFAANDLTHDVCTVCNHGFFRYTSTENKVVEPNPNQMRGSDNKALTVISNNNGVIEYDRPLVTIGISVFEVATNKEYLTGDLVIPGTVKSIGQRAFALCNNLNGTIVLPPSLNKIGNYAFFYCNPKRIEMHSIPQLESESFNNLKCTMTAVLSDDSYVYTGENPYFPILPSKSYSREMSNEWGTVVVPFDIDYNVDKAKGNYRLYHLVDADEETLTFAEYDNVIPAGTPVLVKAVGSKNSNGKYEITLTGASVAAINTTITPTTTVGGLSMNGTYETKELDSDDYFIANNKFWSVGEMLYHGASGVMAAPFRAYLRSTIAGAKARVLSINIADEDDDVTAVETLNAITEGDAEYYDMNGRRINSLQKGVNIVKMSNGKTIKVNIK